MPTRRYKFVAVLPAALLVAGVFGQAFDEYHVKAAFLFNFASFVEWPPGTFAKSEDPFTVCVLGRSSFGRAFESLANRKTADGRCFEVRNISTPREASGCQIVFITDSERLRYRAMIDALQGSVLMVGETDDFVPQGGAIELLLVGSKVRMVINSQAAKDRKLRISSQLLNLSQKAK